MEQPPPRPNSSHSSTSLFQVYLRLRPSFQHAQAQSQQHQPLYPNLPNARDDQERFLTVEQPSSASPTVTAEQVSGSGDVPPTQITIHPPSDSRKRAVEKFAFTRVFEERASQLDVFEGAGVDKLVEGILNEGRDGLVATLGVTGSGKVCWAYIRSSHVTKAGTCENQGANTFLRDLEPYHPWL